MNWKKGDVVVVVTVLVAALVLLGMRALPAVAGNRMLRIELDNRIVTETTLVESEQRTIIVELPTGEAEVEVEDGRVRMHPMGKELCPQGICSHVGWVERSGDAIVCLPNRLVLTIVGGSTEEVLDGVTQ
ncbi:MAG: NusG domain II-containing protein [Firmicutes bacterium]|nr:NusG domain II-containing protein [Bacillota bacterium]